MRMCMTRVYVYWKYTFLSLFSLSFFSFLFIQTFDLSFSLLVFPLLIFISSSPLVSPWQTANRPPNTPNTLFLGCLRGAFSAFCRLNSDPRNKLAADHGGICLLDNLFPSPLGSRPPLRPSPSRSVPSFPSFWPSLCLAFVLAAREKGGLASSSFKLFPLLSAVYTFRFILPPLFFLLFYPRRFFSFFFFFFLIIVLSPFHRERMKVPFRRFNRGPRYIAEFTLELSNVYTHVTYLRPSFYLFVLFLVTNCPVIPRNIYRAKKSPRSFFVYLSLSS